MKTVVIDTNIIIHNPSFIDELKDTNIVIPIIVLEELDNLKSKEFVGYKVRKFFNMMKLEGLMNIINTQDRFGNNNLISTTLDYDTNLLPDCLDKEYGDNKILALSIFKDNPEAVLLTQDYSMVIKAKTMGLKVEYYVKSNSIKLADMYKGYAEILVEHDLIEYFYEKGHLSHQALAKYIKEPAENMFVLAKSNIEEKKSFIAMYKNGKWNKLRYSEERVYGVQAKDAQQKMTLELLLDDDIKIVTITGGVGTGKSFLSLATALSEALDKDKYDCIMLGKNTAPLDKWSYQGYMPGDSTEKLLTHFGNYTSNMEYLHNMKKTNSRKEKLTGKAVLFEYMEQLKIIDLLDISSILGSSFQNKFIIVDEAQSFSIDSMRSIMTRVGEGSKLVVLGDVMQMTVDKLDIDKSGLFFAVQHLKSVTGVGHMTLHAVHRSEVVDDVAQQFDAML